MAATACVLNPDDLPLDPQTPHKVDRIGICLISTCQKVEECLLSRANCISQPVHLHLLENVVYTYNEILFSHKKEGNSG